MLLSVITFNINSDSFAPVVHWSADHGFSQYGLTLKSMGLLIMARWPYPGSYVQASPCDTTR